MISIYLFDDPFLEAFFNDNARAGDCEITGRHELCIDEQLLRPIFDPVVNLYVTYHPQEAAAHLPGGSPSDSGALVWETIENDFGIFSPNNDQEQNKAIIEMMYAVDTRDGSDCPYLHDPVYRFDNGFGFDGGDFQAKYWDAFKEEIKFGNRFFPDNELDLNEMKEIFKFREKPIVRGSVFYRARSSPKKLDTGDMGAPPRHCASVGRANPKGISYLYLGSNKAVCEKEIKLGSGQTYTLGKFQVNEPLQIVDLSNHYIVSPFYFDGRIKKYIELIEIMKMYVKELSSKASSEDPYFDYLPTQYICELIKKAKYDGILFKSSLTTEHADLNLTLFSADKVSCSETTFHSVK
ncbi:MAG: RES family NAD+ phosphorylase [Bdellovibrionaceae bacterium]|nr:RES family NAD+ phosphorylase [Pseudobdellovibrionaceae bacterium]